MVAGKRQESLGWNLGNTVGTDTLRAPAEMRRKPNTTAPCNRSLVIRMQGAVIYGGKEHLQDAHLSLTPPSALSL